MYFIIFIRNLQTNENQLFIKLYFLQTPTYFLQTPIYKIIFLDLFKMYISVHQLIGFSLLYSIFIYSHLLLSFLLISLDNVRSCVFLFSLFII